MTGVLAGEERGYHELDPLDVLDTVLRCRLFDKPLELEAWMDSRIVGLPLDVIAAGAQRSLDDPSVGVSRQCVSLRARNCERTIARRLGLQPSSKPQVEGCAA